MATLAEIITSFKCRARVSTDLSMEAVWPLPSTMPEEEDVLNTAVLQVAHMMSLRWKGQRFPGILMQRRPCAGYTTRTFGS